LEILANQKLFGKMNTSEDELPPETAGSPLPSLAVEHHPPHNQRLFDKLVSDVEKILEGRPWSPFVPSPATISGPSRDDGRQQGRDPGMPPESRKENSRTEGGRQRRHRKGGKGEMERQERHRIGEEREKERREKEKERWKKGKRRQEGDRASQNEENSERTNKWHSPSVQETGTRSKICTKLPPSLLVDSRTQNGSREKGRQGDTERGGARVAQNDGKKRPRFVKPWPENVPYLSKDHRLSESIVQHFAGFCRKCGHNSHWEAKCKTYLDMGTTLSLCHHCLQGFHMENDCKSRRPDVRDKRLFREISAILSCPAVPTSTLPQFVVPPVPDSAAAQNAEALKKIQEELHEIRIMLSELKSKAVPQSDTILPATDLSPACNLAKTPSPAPNLAVASVSASSRQGQSGPTPLLNNQNIPSESIGPCVGPTKTVVSKGSQKSTTFPESTGLSHNLSEETVVAGKGGRDASRFFHVINKELLWTVLFCFLLFLMYCIMTLLPLYLIFTPLGALTGIYFREILWGAGVHTAAAVRTKWKSLPPQSVENGTSDSGPKVEGREAANFRGQKSIVSGSPVEAMGTLSEHKGGDTPPPPNFRSPSPNLPVRGPRPWMV
jgi:hypothetical protein